MAKNLVMTFADPKGEKSNITLKNVKDEITLEEVTGAMDSVIASQLFSTKNGELVRKEYATLVETNKTVYDEL